MAIPVMNFPLLNAEQGMPGLYAANQVSNLIGSALQNYSYGKQAEYLPQTLAEQLKMAQANREYKQVETQWYAPKAQADIENIYKGTIPLSQAQASHLGAEANKINTLLPSERAKAEFLASHPMLNIGLQGDPLTAALISYAGSNDPAFANMRKQMSNGSNLTLPVNAQTAAAFSNAGANVQFDPNIAAQQERERLQQETQNIPGTQYGYQPYAANAQQLLSGVLNNDNRGQNIPPQLQQALSTQQQNVTGQQPQANTALDWLAQGLGANRQEKISRTNYMNSMPAIRAMQNPSVLALASTNRDVARTLAQGLSNQMGNNNPVSEKDVDNIMDYSGNVSEKKESTAAVLNQRQYAANLHSLIEQGDKNMPAYAKYSGLLGKADLLKEKAAVALGGNPSPEFTQYANAVKDFVVIAQDYKRTVSGQSTDKETKIIDSLVSEDTWWNNPKLAMSQWEELKELAKNRISKSLSKGSKQIREELSKGEEAQQNGSKDIDNDPDGIR